MMRKSMTMMIAVGLGLVLWLAAARARAGAGDANAPAPATVSASPADLSKSGQPATQPADWGKAVDGLRRRCWLEGDGKVEIGNPIRVGMEFQNVSDHPIRILKHLSAEVCLPTFYGSEGGRDSAALKPRGSRPIAAEETVLLEPGKTYRLSWDAFGTRRKTPGPSKIVIGYRAPVNTNAEVKDFWSGFLDRVTLSLELVPAGGTSWSNAVNGLRMRCWVDGDGKVEIGNPVRVGMEFQNVSNNPLRILKAASIEQCVPRIYTSDGAMDSYHIESGMPRSIKVEQTVLLAPRQTYQLTLDAFGTWRKPPGPAKLSLCYFSPRNTNPELKDCWSGQIEQTMLHFELVAASEKTIQARVEAAQEGMKKLWTLLEAYRKEHKELPADLQGVLKDKDRTLLGCPATGTTYGYHRQAKDGEALVFSEEFDQTGRLRRMEIDAAGTISVRDLGPAPQEPKQTAKPTAGPLDEPAMTDLWARLGSDDPNENKEAATALAAGGGTAVAFVTPRLECSAPQPEARRLEALIADLSADEYARRENAAAELERAGLASARMMEKARPNAGMEAQARIDKLLDSHRRRGRWAVAVLAWIGTDKARTALQAAKVGDNDLAGRVRFALRLLSDKDAGRWVRKFGVNLGGPRDTAYLFADGQYIDTPYFVERWGLDVYINGRLFRRGRDPENVMGPSQGEHNKQYTERNLSANSVWFIQSADSRSSNPEVMMGGERAKMFLLGAIAECEAAGGADEVSPAVDPTKTGIASEAELRKLASAIPSFRPTDQLYQRLGLEAKALPPAKLDAATMEALWKQLGAEDIARGFQAKRKLASGGDDVVAFLAGKLKAPATGSDEIAAMIARLGDDTAAVREQATAQLALVGWPAGAAMKAALAGNPSAEVRTRLTLLLDALAQPYPSMDSTRQAARALRVLEMIGTPAARKVLTGLAESKSDDFLSAMARERAAHLREHD